ncbi:hypothetical protein ACFX2B_014210 [Malus domestica]
MGDEFGFDSDEFEAKLLGKKENDLDLDGFTPAGVGYGNIKEESIERMQKRMPREAHKEKEEVTMLIKPATSANPAVAMVVDCIDFDGSFPKRAAKSLFAALKGTENDPKLRKDCQSLFLWPQRNLLSFLKELAGPRGNVWVIRAQNAGQSTLINALAKKEGAKVTKLTEAPVPGTTLGIWKVGGIDRSIFMRLRILSAKAVLFDTPGLVHPYLVSMRLDLICKHSLIRAGQTIHVGGLARLDLVQASVETIYLTVWASPNISLHMEKIENADETWRKHGGIRLQPPIGADRAAEMRKREEREIKVSGASWDVNSIDIAVAGLGWFSLGLKGEATLALWTYA